MHGSLTAYPRAVTHYSDHCFLFLEKGSVGRLLQDQQAVRAGSLAASLRTILAPEWGPQPASPLLGVRATPTTITIPRQPVPLYPAAAGTATAAAAAAGVVSPGGASRTAAHIIGGADDEDDIDDEVRCAWASLRCSERFSHDGKRA